MRLSISLLNNIGKREPFYSVLRLVIERFMPLVAVVWTKHLTECQVSAQCALAFWLFLVTDRQGILRGLGKTT